MHADKVALLAGIIRDTGAHVVVSSTWRKYDHMLIRVKRMLYDIGATFAGCTPVLERQENGLWRAEPRGHEIRQWLDDHPGVTRFVILDDDHDMRTLTPFLVATESFTGLTPEIAVEVRRRLNVQAVAPATPDAASPKDVMAG